MHPCDLRTSSPERKISEEEFPKEKTGISKENQAVSDVANRKINTSNPYALVASLENELSDAEENPTKTNVKPTEESDKSKSTSTPAKKWKRTSGKILWKRLSHTDLTNSGKLHLEKAEYNWTVVAEKISVIIKDLKFVRAQGYKGVVIKEEFWTQSLYAYVEGSAGFPDITRIWKVETEKLQAEGKPTLSFEEWLEQHHAEICKKNPNPPKIQYLDPAHAKKYQANIVNGKFTINDLRGIMPLDQQTHSTINYSNGDWMEKDNLPGGKGYANFVISKEKEFFLGSHSGGIFHHTSFQKGAVVIGAGATVIGYMPPNLMQDVLFIEQMKLKSPARIAMPRFLQILNGQPLIGLNPKPTQEGEMRILTSTSGHYKPDKENLLDTLRVCKEKGIDLSRVITIEESEIGQAYFSSGLEYLTTLSACKPYRCNNIYVASNPDNSEVLGLINKSDTAPITKHDLNGLMLLHEHGFDLKKANIFKITSFGILTFSVNEYIRSHDKSTTVHPTNWNLGTLEHDDKGFITLISSTNYKVILSLLAFLKNISTPEDYAKMNILYSERSFKSPEEFVKWF